LLMLLLRWKPCCCSILSAELLCMQQAGGAYVSEPQLLLPSTPPPSMQATSCPHPGCWRPAPVAATAAHGASLTMQLLAGRVGVACALRLVRLAVLCCWGWLWALAVRRWRGPRCQSGGTCKHAVSGAILLHTLLLAQHVAASRDGRLSSACDTSAINKHTTLLA
jgi:hypothetical protein